MLVFDTQFLREDQRGQNGISMLLATIRPLMHLDNVSQRYSRYLIAPICHVLQLQKKGQVIESVE
jgi:hypothetical protein